MSDWTVTLAGDERFDGEAPYTWVVEAPSAEAAVAIARRLFEEEEQDPDIVVIEVLPGEPGPKFQTLHFTDARPQPAELTAQQSRIRVELEGLLALLDEVIPVNTHHHAVTDLRRAARQGIRLADQVHPHDWYEQRQTDTKKEQTP